MKSTKYIFFSVAVAMGLTSCEPEFKDKLSDASYSAGTADFTTYVAIGNSLTSGYMDGTMYRTGQQNSFPNLLAKQFALVGGGEFTQPSYADDVNNVGGIANLAGFNPKMIINLTKAGGAGPEVINATPTITLAQQAKAFNNMGVPGAKSFHLLSNTYGNPTGVGTYANPYFVRMAKTTSSTVLGDAMSLNPTFFTNWIGSNDVLAYALSGGTGADQTGNMNVATYDSNDITDPTVFASVYSNIMNGLTANGAKGVVATVPDVTSIPYFTTVPYNPLTVTTLGQGDAAVGAATILSLNNLFNLFNGALVGNSLPARFQTYSPTQGNPVMIIDESLPAVTPIATAVLEGLGLSSVQAQALAPYFAQARHATANDLLVLTASSAIGTDSGFPAPLDKLGVTFPLADQYVLIPSEQTTIKTATTAFNTTIKQIAASKDIPVVDMNAIMKQLSTNGIVYGGIKYNANYFSTSTVGIVLFSLDGVHPNARGYALVANEVMKTIENHYGAKLPQYVPNSFSGSAILPSN